MTFGDQLGEDIVKWIMQDQTYTTFILHGGNTSLNSQNNKKFFTEINSIKKKTLKVLLIYFHRKKDNWDSLKLKTSKQFRDNNLDKIFEFPIASENSEEFTRQLKNSDIIYAPGGSTFPVVNAYKKVKNFRDLIKGRYYMGSSGGAYAVCKYFFENVDPGVYQGMDFLPYKIIGHVNSDYVNPSGQTWEKKINELKSHNEKLELLALEESEYRLARFFETSHTYKKIKKYIADSYGAKDEANLAHFQQTVYWLQRLNPSADEAMVIAAYAHDIERAFRSESAYTVDRSDKGFADPSFLKEHQEKGARIISEFLTQENAGHILIEKVSHMISKHEVGGDKAQNLLKDADSLSFFEVNVPGFTRKFVPKYGKQKVKEKFDWMYERITSDLAKNWATPMYQDSLIQLEKHEL